MGAGFRPAIVVVADATRDRIVEELAARYARDYELVSLDLHEAKARLVDMTAAHHKVALIVCEYRLGEFTAVGVFKKLQSALGAARRLVLVPASDFRDALPDLIDALSAGLIDGYFLVPQGPRDEEFHAGITDQLSEWTWVSGTVSIDVVRVVADGPSPDLTRIVDFLDRSGVPHRIYSPDSEIGAAVLAEAGRDALLPVVQQVGGALRSRPSVAEMARLMDAASTTAVAEDEVADLLIVGAGPAGLAAAVYGASEGLTTVAVEAEAVGGQAGTSSMIRNYLGFPRGISGMRLAQRACIQAMRFGTRFVAGTRATALELGTGDAPVHRLVAGDRTFLARAVLIASGVAYRRLGVADVEALVGRGVNYGAATSTARDMRGRRVVVVGGGNSAGQAAMHLARFASHVTVVIRRPDLDATMSAYLIAELAGRANVEVRSCTEVVDGGGEGVLEWLALRDLSTGQTERVEASGLYLLLGAEPRCEWLPDDICLDDHGFVQAGRDVPERFWRDGVPPAPLATVVPGVFVAGDIRSGSMKRVAAATGEGSSVVGLVHAYLGS